MRVESDKSPPLSFEGGGPLRPMIFRDVAIFNSTPDAGFGFVGRGGGKVGVYENRGCLIGVPILRESYYLGATLGGVSYVRTTPSLMP